MDDQELRTALMALIEKWRAAEVWEREEMGNEQAAQTLDQCANELEAVIRPSTV